LTLVLTHDERETSVAAMTVRGKIMKTYEFSLVLSASEVSDADCDTLQEAGCDDGTVVTRNGVTHIAFDREAESLEEAIRSATAQVRGAGFEVVRVEMDALV
jgi:hypothetical protein